LATKSRQSLPEMQPFIYCVKVSSPAACGHLPTAGLTFIKLQGQNLFCRNGTDLIGLVSGILRKIIKSVLKKKNFLANVGFFD